MKIGIVAAALIAAAGIAQADVIGFDDFDGGGNYTSRAISPDNSGNNGAFGGSNFDVFGITDRTVNFDFADDSLSIFPTDSFGILKEGKTDKVFGVEDLDNGDNPGGTGSATWTFDISGATDLSLAIDFAAMGDFESGDNSYFFTAQIDAGPAQTIFSIDSDDNATMDYILEGGTVVSLNDPLLVNGTTYLNNDFQTLSGAIAGAGSTLTITFTAGANNGGSEVFIFDNVTVNGVPTPGTAALLGLGGLVATRRRR